MTAGVTGSIATVSGTGRFTGSIPANASADTLARRPGSTGDEISVVRDLGNRVPSSLKLKTILGVFIAGLLLAVSGLTFFLVSGIFDRFAEAVRQDLAWKAEQLAVQMARATEVGLAAGDLSAVEPVLSAYLKVADLQGVVAVRADGKILVKKGQIPAVAPLLAIGEGVVGTGPDYFWACAEGSIEGAKVGKVAAVVSARRLHESVRLRTRILLIAAGACLAALLASLFFVSGYLGPLLRFAERTLEKLQHLNATLEHRVDERTAALRQANGQLTESLEKNQAMQRQLMDASRRAGMADVATTVLHNVGNVLNSVNVSANVVMDTMQGSRLNGLAKAAELMRARKDDLSRFLTEDDKGKKLPLYLCGLADAASAERASMLKELESLQKNVDHIKVIVSRQQAQARSSLGVVEDVSIPDLLEDAIKFVGSSYEKHHVHVEREFDELPSVRLDRHKLFQIVMNLLSNAKHAVLAVQDPARERRVTVRLRLRSDTRFAIEIEDNGCGIAPENLKKIFTYGFTTKREGHGFGLHSCANTAAEMGGSLGASSPGPDAGARFILELPLVAPGERPSNPEPSTVDLPNFRAAAIG
jgi:signal transduction histidine kinase